MTQLTTPTISRRRLLQWLGGMTAGAVLSPTPFALIDDLTIATQTRGRSRYLPRGPLDRRLVRCPGCPAACRLEILTVADQPYLCVPAHGERGAVGCPVLPVIHQLRQHRTLPTGRLCDGGAFAGEEISASHATSIALTWLEESAPRGPVALLDLGPASRGITPLQCLGSRIPGAGLLRAHSARAPLAALARHLELDDDLEIAVDPDRIRRIVPIDTSTRRDEAAVRQLAELLDGVARRGHVPSELRGTVVLAGRDGVGGRPDFRVEELALLVNLALGALDPDGPLVIRRRAPFISNSPEALPETLEEVPDASLALLFVDASRAYQAIPWRRLRRKLLPSHGRMIVFAPWTTTALQHADLVLATAAPLEIEELVGGDDLHPELRLALSLPLRSSERSLVDPMRLAAALDAGPVPDPLTATADALLLDRGGRLVDDDGSARPATTLNRDTLVTGLREGGTWHGSTVAWRPTTRRQGLDGVPSPSSVVSDASRRDRPIRVRLSAPILAGAGVPLPPVLAKLSRETRLVTAEGTARAHPRTLRRLHRGEGSLVRLRTNRGELDCRLRSDVSIEADTLVLALGFDPGGFDTEVRRGVDVLGHLDLDPQHDTPDQCILEEVV